MFLLISKQISPAARKLASSACEHGFFENEDMISPKTAIILWRSCRTAMPRTQQKPREKARIGPAEYDICIDQTGSSLLAKLDLT
ncbi:hypothetical protein J2W40_001174 [Sphingobium xenophagum]|uniref:Uncharacterized protein n=1 Tax=Sphingobium xenophagum TaxID=121428 RepID=A0ABU1WYG6_SPHXE|nr:hypothetical protein [Sphingobium xenophagum]MDR7154362.1 hypothetical protein [Sphingobium xenophagum]